VVPTDPDHLLPQTDADVIAARVSQPGYSGTQYPSASRSPDSSAVLEDEDFELQAALHASLDGAGRVPMHRPPVGQGTGGSRTLSPGSSTGFAGSSFVVSPPPIPPPSTRPVDQPMENPVAASMARNQAMLERMRREQEAALREHYRDEVSSFDGRPYAGLGNRVQDEEEQLRRALAESEEMARGQQGPAHARTGGSDSDAAGTGTRTGTQAEGWSPGRLQGGRVYDDEDAELQAALQASLESAPPEAHIPDDTATAPPRAPHIRHLPLPHTSIPASGSRAGPLTDAYDEDEDGDEVYSDDDDGEDTAAEEMPSDAAQGEDVNIEEMRRRRLARFGGP
jgi:ataxin-3